MSKPTKISIRFELDAPIAEAFKIQLIRDNKTISTKLRELILQYLNRPDLVSVEAISVKVDMEASPDRWDEYKAELEGGEVIIPTSKFGKPAIPTAVLSKAEKLAILGLKPSPRPEPTKPKNTGFSTSHGKVEGKVKRVGDQYSILLSDGRSFTVDDSEFHIDGRTFDFKEMRPNMLFDISLFDQTKSDQIELQHSDQVKTDQTTFTDLFLSGLNPNNIDTYAIAEYMHGDDVTQPAPAEPIELDFLKNILPVDERK